MPLTPSQLQKILLMRENNTPFSSIAKELNTTKNIVIGAIWRYRQNNPAKEKSPLEEKSPIKRISLDRYLKMDFTTCRWIFGDPGADQAWNYCEEPPLSEKSFCRKHQAIAYHMPEHTRHMIPKRLH